MVMQESRVADLNAAVARARGGVAILWEYAASLSELTIRITWRGTSENLHIVCNGCTRLEADAGWNDVNLEWEHAGSGAIRLIDRQAHFLLLCAQVRVFDNIEPIYWEDR
ncbi:hypothetical protein PMI14_03557 [Acidovorax sp. CF316]|uniref:hypothetical protein n=1 Tax=Acidovorax sp. CF316 TaxID=1144317 RepID=UPI00026BCFB0|nr:hypothetical protein [Acidovorax sp. CF316]EJE51761.1 hypothetical protein PMI14_03557 [Acidovorax sp. CF316]